MKDTPGSRLRKLRADLGYEQKELASLLGVSPGTIGFAERDQRSPSKALLNKLFERLAVSPNWVLHGNDPVFVINNRPTHRAAHVSAPDTSVPAHGDVRLDGNDYQLLRCFDALVSAGGGALVPSDDVIDRIAFTRSWLLRQGINGDLAGLVQVRGDSMAPHIRDGSLVLVHFAERDIDNGRIYAFSIRGEVFIKRLTVLGDGVLAISDNPAHPPVEITGPDAEALIVHGRVRACISQF